MKAIRLVCLCLGLALFCARSIHAAQPENVTLIQLIANPTKFDGELIRVIGFLRLEFEGNVLYLHREDYDYAVFGDGIWVQVTPEITKRQKVLNMHYVLLEGVFDSKDRGHLDAWGGSLTHIQRAESWSNGR